MKSSIEITFYFLSAGDGQQYKKAQSIANALGKLEFVCSHAPGTSQWEDSETKEIYWRPKIGDIIVSTETEFKKYPTPTGAFKEAIRLKNLLSAKISAYKKAYQRRDLNRRIIREHYLSINN
jgi:hypothetical protein